MLNVQLKELTDPIIQQCNISICNKVSIYTVLSFIQIVSMNGDRPNSFKWILFDFHVQTQNIMEG